MSAGTANDQPTSPTSVSRAHHGEPCPGCRRALPIRAKRADENVTHWECTACRSPLTGILLRDAAPQRAAHVRLSQRHFDTVHGPPIPEELRQLVREFCDRRQQREEADDRRNTPRLPQQLDLTVVPLGDDWTPQGGPVLGIVVDLAAHGLGMITASPVSAPFVAVQIRHAAGLMQLLGTLAWSKDCGQGFHHAGVQFVLRFGR